MVRKTLLVCITALSVSTANATDAESATYILQVASNLGCQPLDIELLSQQGNVKRTIRYGDNAFAAVTLPPGAYSFGNVTCSTDIYGVEKLDSVLSELKSIELSANQAYFGGKLILKYEESEQTTPDVLDNCPRNISKARGEVSNECRDGVGVKTEMQTARKINIYAPAMTNEDLSKVRMAMQMNEEQLPYVPLQTRSKQQN